MWGAVHCSGVDFVNNHSTVEREVYNTHRSQDVSMHDMPDSGKGDASFSFNSGKRIN